MYMYMYIHIHTTAATTADCFFPYILLSFLILLLASVRYVECRSTVDLPNIQYSASSTSEGTYTEYIHSMLRIEIYIIIPIIHSIDTLYGIYLTL